MVLFRHQDADARPMAGAMDFVSHVEHLGDRGEGRGDVRRRNLKPLKGELDPHQKVVGLRVCVVIGVEDVAAEIVDEARHTGDDTLAVLAVDEDDDRFLEIGTHVMEASRVTG